jgi:alpha-tubulin suppressor-like RCC1 family protein
MNLQRWPRAFFGPLAIVLSACGDSSAGPDIDEKLVATVSLTPAADTILLGETVGLRVVIEDAQGSRILGVPVDWSSSDGSVASVDSTGRVTGEGAGVATITATAQGKSGTANMTGLIVDLAAVGGGEFLTCGLTTGGAAYCWGFNGSGAIGNGGTAGSAVPSPVVGGLTFASLAVGDSHACGITTDGTAFCWGQNDAGALGDGSANGPETCDVGGPVRCSTVPVPVAGNHTFAALSAGNAHTCGLTTSGSIYCWGFNGFGQLGDGTDSSSITPAAVSGGLTFASVAAGNTHTCAVITSGDAYCWGDNGGGQLGDAVAESSSVPVLVSGGHTFESVGAGVWHSCGVTTSATAYCWGLNSHDELGDGTGVQSITPVPVAGGHSFLTISAGWDFSCGVTQSGAAYCWGIGTSNQLGRGEPTSSAVPVAVAGGLTFSFVDTGSGQHACGVTTNGTVYCWGNGIDGQLGIGGPTLSQNRLRPSPVRVLGQP